MIARNILITDATIEPVTDQQALDHLREDQSNLPKIKLYLAAARQSVESELISLKLTQVTYELQMDGWYTDLYGFPYGYAKSYSSYPNNAGYIVLPKCPLVSITSIKYDDLNNVEQTLASSNYFADTASLPGRIRFTANATLPSVYDKPNCVRIRYVAGYGAAGDTDKGQASVPPPLKAAVLERLGQLYEHRLEDLTGGSVSENSVGVTRLISPYRIPV